MMIAHPPCQFISFAGQKYWNTPGRARNRLTALDFFLKLMEAPIEKICIENPIGCADGIIRKHDQIIHPYYFGDSELKRTCLWLKNLPKLVYNMNNDLFNSQTACEKPEPVYIDKTGKKRYKTEAISGASRFGAKDRAKFYPGIAKAMADQWGKL